MAVGRPVRRTRRGSNKKQAKDNAKVQSNSDIDFENSYVTTRSKKTRKSMGSRPVPLPIMAELKKYVSGLDTKQENIFNDNFSRYRWKQIRRKLKLDDFTFHDLRKTFSSVLAQNGVSTVVIQKLLEYSSPDLTNKVYTILIFQVLNAKLLMLFLMFMYFYTPRDSLVIFMIILKISVLSITPTNSLAPSPTT